MTPIQALVAVSSVCIALSAFAQTENALQRMQREEKATASLRALFKAAANPAQVVGQTFTVTGGVGRMDMERDGTGKPLFISVLSTGTGTVSDYTSEALICVMSQSDAAAMKMNTLVTVQAEVRGVERPMILPIPGSPAPFNVPKPGTWPAAACKLVAAKAEALADSAPSKANRVAEVGTSGALTAAKLCAPTETVVFACHTGKKTVSVCGSGSALQYRFGLAADALDITVDAKGAKQGQGPLVGGGYWFLRFLNGKTSYTVYTAESNTLDKAGVLVEEGGKRLANLSCKGAATVGASKLNLPVESAPFDIP